MTAPDPARGWDIETEARALLTDVLFAIDRRRGGVEIGKKHLQAAFDAGQAAGYQKGVEDAMEAGRFVLEATRTPSATEAG